MLKTLLASAILTLGVATAAIAAPTISTDPAGIDMNVVHEMLFNHDKIRRTVTNLPDGIRTVTESDDPQVTKEIKDHVASMEQRLKDGRIFNVASQTLPAIFANNNKIHTDVVQTPTGVIVTQTSIDSATVAALQAHAGEVSELARGGMVALMRQVMANGGPSGEGMMNHMRMPNGGSPMMAEMMQRMMQSGGHMGEPSPQTTP